MKTKILKLFCMIGIMVLGSFAFITISNAGPEWYIEDDPEQGISWYYEVVSGEAVNVRTTGGNAQLLTKLVVPETLGGYPVTSLKGKEGIKDAFWGTSPGNILETKLTYLFAVP